MITISLTSCKNSDYKKAVGLQELGNYHDALKLYQNIENYKDSSTRIATCKRIIESIDAFNSAKQSAEQKNNELDSIIAETTALITKNAPTLDKSVTPALETAISNAKSAKQNITELPIAESEILNAFQKLNSIDYSKVLSNLSEKKSAFEKSVKQYSLVDSPSESYIIDCLKKVSNIIDISAVTEDNDPNGQLNKMGGYTAQVYFSRDLVNQTKVYGASLIEKGTDAGGSIEVYTNVKDAIARNEYLSSFDGTAFTSGSHSIIGTVLVRTSNELTASEQKMLESNIIAALTEIIE